MKEVSAKLHSACNSLCPNAAIFKDEQMIIPIYNYNYNQNMFHNFHCTEFFGHFHAEC